MAHVVPGPVFPRSMRPPEAPALVLPLVVLAPVPVPEAPAPVKAPRRAQ